MPSSTTLGRHTLELKEPPLQLGVMEAKPPSPCAFSWPASGHPVSTAARTRTHHSDWQAVLVRGALEHGGHRHKWPRQETTRGEGNAWVVRHEHHRMRGRGTGGEASELQAKAGAEPASRAQAAAIGTWDCSDAQGLGEERRQVFVISVDQRWLLHGWKGRLRPLLHLDGVWSTICPTRHKLLVSASGVQLLLPK